MAAKKKGTGKNSKKQKKNLFRGIGIKSNKVSQSKFLQGLGNLFPSFIFKGKNGAQVHAEANANQQAVEANQEQSTQTATPPNILPEDQQATTANAEQEAAKAEQEAAAKAEQEAAEAAKAAAVKILDGNEMDEFIKKFKKGPYVKEFTRLKESIKKGILNTNFLKNAITKEQKAILTQMEEKNAAQNEKWTPSEAELEEVTIKAARVALSNEVVKRVAEFMLAKEQIVSETLNTNAETKGKEGLDRKSFKEDIKRKFYDKLHGDGYKSFRGIGDIRVELGIIAKKLIDSKGYVEKLRNPATEEATHVEERKARKTPLNAQQVQDAMDSISRKQRATQREYHDRTHGPGDTVLRSEEELRKIAGDLSDPDARRGYVGTSKN